ncbi:uncharacterized protein K452DRAFT_280884 [Aplosporella prunicola CBS 121167]|uniref:Helicase ATP-binding domain-containing protein n=1 Tax=Aplosporella prunicola CBS 121167 TaxID=1176127 RepID=A0A6A6AY01_9PEZI|nr:uncharacterized protein K452DRAFT_280884 [Aplosporella prunicola CBS 121167]KAF2135855.1 hypothetical protein K452DRAFT_280884 [Aplosporella prunicola CBS 121167]
MNPAQLLNPKAFKKSNGRASPRVSQEGQSTPPVRPQFDPNALLNPKAPAKRPHETDGLGQDDLVQPSDLGMGSMIERMHGVQRREDQPAKKPRLDHDTNSQKADFKGAGQGTVLSEYVTSQQEQSKKDSRPTREVVDLTADDDEDIVLVKDAGAEEVVLGRLEGPIVHCHIVPGMKHGAFQGSSSVWPAIDVQLVRNPSGHDYNVSVFDATKTAFGKLDIRTAMGLVPLIDASAAINLRIKARLPPRKKKAAPWTPCSDALPVDIHLFAPRKHAKNIGKALSQKQLWLRDPNIPRLGVPYFNPHVPTTSSVPLSTSRQQGSSYTFVARTQEEVRSDVISMFDSLTKSGELPQMEQPATIKTPLLLHQQQGLHFMTSREMDDSEGDGQKESASLWKPKTKRNGQKFYYNIITGQESRARPASIRGGILADMMGLGKTLSILSLVSATKGESYEWAKKSPPQTPGQPLLKLNTRATLLICPLSTVANWQEQINAHVAQGSMNLYVYHGQPRASTPEELKDYDIVITTYHVVASEFNSGKPLSLINWFRIVLDEAHMIRSQSTKQSIATCALHAQRRWAVTGTPVQNRLDDLGALIKFLRIKPFDDKGGFAQYILTPFKNADPDILPKLRILVDSITLRRLKDRINLPPRHDKLVRLKFSAEEGKLYDFFARDAAAKMSAMASGREKLAKNQMGHILRVMGRLRMICAHGAELLGEEDMKLTEGLSYGNAIELGDDDEEEEEKPALTPKQAYDMLHLLRESDMNHCGICDTVIGNNDLSESDDDAARDSKGTMGERVKPRMAGGNYMNCPLCDSYARMSLFQLSQDEADKDEEARLRVRDNPRLAKQLGRYGGPHTKVKALIHDLLESRAWNEAHPDEPPIKSVVFSGWTSYLDLISIALEDEHFTYTRLDGTMSRKKRKDALDAFRDDTTVQIMLISIAAGGLGLNLTSGSRAYVMEPQYNPAAEAQAVDRVHRLGQKREVTITRFIMENSFEEKMLELQEKKKDLADLSMNRNAKLDREEAARKRLEDLRSLFR